MEENIQEVATEEKVEEVVEEKVEWEILSYNKHDPYIPTEYQIIDYQNSWKKCYCGRVTRFNDNFCPSCGQRLGRPSMDE